MLMWSVALLVSIYSIVDTNGKVGYCSNIQGYYWKDYFYRVPEDALPCGRDEEKRHTYCGQGLYSNYLIPGRIYRNTDSLHIELNRKEAKIKKNFKVLCTANPQFFEWIATNNSHLFKIQRHLVVGGSSPDGCLILIGRKSLGAELVVGRLWACARNTGLLVCYDKKCNFYNSYEVLSYNPAI